MAPNKISYAPQAPPARAREAEGRVIWLEGDHDLATVASLWATIQHAIALDDADLVVDLSGVHFMGAATISVVVRARKILGLRSRSLTLRSPSAGAQLVLDLCGVAYLPAPRRVIATGVADTTTVLGTWVEVPATDPVGCLDETSASRSGEAEPAGDEHWPPARTLSSAEIKLAVGVPATSLARGPSRGG